MGIWCSDRTVIYLTLAVRLSPGMATLACMCATVLLLGLSQRHRTASETGGAFIQASNRLYTAVTEHLDGMKEAKSYGAEPRHVALFADITRAQRRLVLRFVRHSADTKMCFDIGAVVVVSLMLYSAVALVQVPMAELLLLLVLCARLLPQCSAMQQGYQQVLHMLPAFAAVMAMQARCAAAAEPPPGGTGKAIRVERGMQFQEVVFRYDTVAHTATIRGLSCSIPARRTTAIVGPSGAGKSTMADPLMGLLVPE